MIESFDELNETKVTTIVDGAFLGCYSLKNIGLQNIASIGAKQSNGTKGVFGSSQLEDVHAPLCEFIGQGVFNNCAKLKHIFLPKLKTLHYYGNGGTYVNYWWPTPFEGCNALKAMFLPSIVHFNQQLNDVDGRIIDLGRNVSNVSGLNKFGKIDRTTFVIRNMSVPILAIQQSYDALGRFYVPSASVDLYKSATTWSNYANKIFPIGGVEWVSEFGSEDEYADVDKYVTDSVEREILKETYRNV